MKDLADFFSTAKGFFSCALGTGLITFILTYPAKAVQLVDGEWRPCQFVCRLGGGPTKLVNVLGWDALADYKQTAAVIAFVVGLICGAISSLLSNMVKSSNT